MMKADTVEKLQPVSIWSPVKEGDAWFFVRPEPLVFGDHYAARRSFPARKGENTIRVCFFGESAAAGYLYAPHLTPAQLLAGQLREITGEDRFEVIDLARTNETLASLVLTVERAMQLQPDLLVIFAGNNWNMLETPEYSPYYPSNKGRRRLARALREGGIMGVVEAAARARLEKAASALAIITGIVDNLSIPVILVVPEVNLADWESRQPVVWLPEDGTTRWYDYYHQAIQSLREEDGDSALSAAQQMLDLDRGLNPTAFRLMARSSQLLGKGDLARLACQAEVDSNHYATLCFLGAPQATSMDKAVLRRAAGRHGFAIVDLPEIFAEQGLADRSLFLDYCHLTARGMKVAMAAVTAEILRLVGIGPDRTWKELVAALPDPEIVPEDEATTHLGAAIHTAHRSLFVVNDDEIITHWIRKALESSPGIQTAILDVVEARCAPAPAVLTAAQQRNYVSRYRLSYQHGWRADHLDLRLIDAVCRALAEKDSQLAHRISQILLVNLAVTREGIDLLHPPRFLWEPLARFLPEVMDFADLTERATYRCPWPATILGFVAYAEQDVTVEITARLPDHGVDERRRVGKLFVSVNDWAGTPVKVSPKWRRRTLRIPVSAVNRGLNRLSLTWPPLPPVGSSALQQAAARLERGLEADFHPIFGELYSVSVRLA